MTIHHGYRRNTRRVFRKNVRARGQPGLTRWLIDYEPDQKVDIICDPSFHKHGLPHRRFHGKTGTVKGPRGNCYEVNVRDGRKMKTLFVGREHLRAAKGS